MIKKDFVRAYTLGWYHHGQMTGEFLWDVPIEGYDGDLSNVREIAKIQYDKL